MTTYKFLRWMHLAGRMDIGEVLERYRGEDAGDLKGIEVVEKWTCLNVLEKVFFF